MSKEVENYYNKFCQEKRLTRRHGHVDYVTSMKYIHKYLEGKEDAKILDVGAELGVIPFSLPRKDTMSQQWNWSNIISEF